MNNDLNIIDILNLPDSKLSDDAKAIRNYFTQLFRCLPNNVYWMNSNNILLGCNEGVLKFVGVENYDDLIGKNYQEITAIAGWTPEQGMSFQNDDQEVMRTGKAKINVEEPVFYNADGKPVYYLSSRLPLYSDQGKVIGIVGISVDISDRKEKERLVIEAEAHQTQLAEQEKFYKLASQAAHDIRSPLQVLDSLSQDMRKRFSEDESRIFNDAIKRINNIAEGLLNQYRQDKVSNFKGLHSYPIWLLLLKLVEEKRIVLAATHHNIKIILDPTVDKTISAKFHVPELQRILSNLINNASEAFDDSFIADNKIQLKLTTENKMAVLQIIDNGKGISEKRVAKFNDTGMIETFGGHGLGLSHAYNTVRRWGGDIKIDSVIGQGTTVKLYFPLALPPFWLRLNLHITHNTQIYLVDEEEFTLSQLEEILVKKGANRNNIKKYSDVHNFCQAYDLAQHEDVFVFMSESFNKSEILGMDVLLEKELTTDSALVTNDFLDEKLRQQVIAHSVRLLPKPLINDLSVTIEAESKLTVDYVVMDDLASVTGYWELRALEKNIAIKTFNNSLDFIRFVQNCESTVKIYIDNDLGEGATGLEISKKLSDMGFKNIYLMTSRDDVSEKEYPWLKAVVGKKVPFDD